VQQRDAPAAAAQAGERGGRAIEQQDAVGEAGERVVQALALKQLAHRLELLLVEQVAQSGLEISPHPRTLRRRRGGS